MTNQKTFAAITLGGHVALAMICIPGYCQDIANAETDIHANVLESIRLLDSDSYLTRQRAADNILRCGEPAINALESERDNPDAEVRMQCRRLIKRINDETIRRELNHLLTHFDPLRSYRLPGWQPFRAACGDDASGRGLYRRLLDHDIAFMKWLQRVEDDPSYDIENQLVDQQRYLSPSSQRLHSGDPLIWSMMLLAATNEKICQVPVLGSHIRCGLQCGPTIESLTQGSNREATLRLVRSWVSRQSSAYASRSTLRIAMLYGCNELAHQMSVETLRQSHAPPAAVQMALLFLAQHQPQESEKHLTTFLADERVCQIWQVASIRRRAIQTQVRDTAMALLLHLQGIDPRGVGYQDIEADPLTIFAEQTLGFETEAQRLATHQQGRTLLGLTP
ncbi:MAG: hypothetical protein R3C05_31080 [Pirellulaceae bacterium]